MKILLIDVNYKNSSTGKIVHDIYETLNTDSYTVAVCYGRGPVINESNVYKFSLDLETYLHSALSRVTGYNGCFSNVSTRRLLKYIDDFKPDVIHIHELHAYFVNIEQLIEYIKKKRIPVIWTFHCEYMYTGKCGYAYDCEKWKNQCGNCPAVGKYPKSLLFDQTTKMFQKKKSLLTDFDFTIVTPSKWLADRVKQSFLKDKPIKVIHNGIDTENVFFPRNKREIEMLKKEYGIGEKKIVLSVAPNIMDKRKGGKTVLEIAKINPNLQFILVGADDNKCYRDNVLLIKRTKDQNELARWYTMADLFLICSNMENFPTTCLEALACGTPIVGIDSGGTKETAPFPYGVFVEGKIDLLQKEILSQLSIDFVRDEIREVAVQLYSKHVMCKSYEELYMRCMESQRF